MHAGVTAAATRTDEQTGKDAGDVPEIRGGVRGCRDVREKLVSLFVAGN